MAEHPHKVVIVGGGFGGLAAAKALRNTSAQVILIDRSNHHLFQPLLYQVATAVLGPAQIASPTGTYWATKVMQSSSWERLRGEQGSTAGIV
jgi:NADH dehydrogenase FAD-containing subunit